MTSPTPDDPLSVPPAATGAPLPLPPADVHLPHAGHAGRQPLPLKSYVWLGGAVIVALAALHWLGGVLTPFLFGAILAYLGHPIVDRCARAGIPRTLGTILALLVLLAAMLAVVLVLVPLVQAEIGMLVQRLPALADLYAERVAPWLQSRLGMTLALDVATAKDVLVDNAQQLQGVGLKLLAGVRSGGALLLALAINVALVPVVTFYLLRDGRGILARLGDLVPRRWYPAVRSMGREIDHVLGEFLHGQILVMVSLALFYSIGLSLVGLQYALPIGILTGLLVFIPYIGFGLGLVLGMLAALLQWHGMTGFLLVAGVYLAGQLLENYVLVPYLVGDRIGLHPLAVIFALLAFGALFGFAGILFALPASAALLVALRRLRGAYIASPMYWEP